MNQSKTVSKPAIYYIKSRQSEPEKLYKEIKKLCKRGGKHRQCLLPELPKNAPSKYLWLRIGSHERGYNYFIQARTYLYGAFFGEIPTDDYLYNICGNQTCCNIDHLEALPQREVENV